MLLALEKVNLENGFWSENFIMYYIVSSMSFSAYLIVAIIALMFAIYGIYEMHTKKPGHPMIWMLPFAIVTDVFLIIYRCTLEFSTNVNLQETMNILTIVSIVLFVISLIVTFIIASKKNYTAQGKKAKQTRSTLISCGIVAVISIIFIFVVSVLDSNNII